MLCVTGNTSISEFLELHLVILGHYVVLGMVVQGQLYAAAAGDFCEVERKERQQPRDASLSTCQLGKDWGKSRSCKSARSPCIVNLTSHQSQNEAFKLLLGIHLFCKVWEMILITRFLRELWTQAGMRNCFCKKGKSVLGLHRLSGSIVFPSEKIIPGDK